MLLGAGAVQRSGKGEQCAGRLRRHIGCPAPERDHLQLGVPFQPKDTRKQQGLLLTQPHTRRVPNGPGRHCEETPAALDTRIDIADADDTAVGNGTVMVPEA